MRLLKSIILIYSLSSLAACATASDDASIVKMQACDYGTPAADMLEGFKQYDFIIGDFDIRAHQWTGEGWSDGFRKARWRGQYVLGGRAVMEEWFDFDPDEVKSPEGGVNIRVYEPTENIWKMMWVRSDQRLVTELTSELRDDGKMHMGRIYPTPDDRKIYFETYEPGRWARFNYIKNENGEWVPSIKLDAFKRECK